MIWLFIATIVVELTLLIPSQSQRTGIIGAVKNRSFFRGPHGKGGKRRRRRRRRQEERAGLLGRFLSFLRRVKVGVLHIAEPQVDSDAQKQRTKQSMDLSSTFDVTRFHRNLRMSFNGNNCGNCNTKYRQFGIKDIYFIFVSPKMIQTRDLCKSKNNIYIYLLFKHNPCVNLRIKYKTNHFFSAAHFFLLARRNRQRSKNRSDFNETPNFFFTLTKPPIGGFVKLISLEWNPHLQTLTKPPLGVLLKWGFY